MGKARSLVFLTACLIALVACSGYRTTVLPRMSFTEEVTNNVGLSSVNPEYDVVTGLSPGVTVAVTGRDREAKVDYDPTLKFYARSHPLVGTLHKGVLTARNAFSRHSVMEFKDTVSRTDDPVVTSQASFSPEDDPQQPDDLTRRKGREPYTNNAATLRFQHEFGPGDVFYVSYLNTMLRNDDPTVEDSTRHQPAVGVDYWFGPRYGIKSKFQYTRGDFSLDTSAFNSFEMNTRFIRKFTRTLNAFLEYRQTYKDYVGEGDNYMLYDGTVGVEYHVSALTYFTLSTGIFYRDPEEAGGRTGYVLRGDMARKFSRGDVRLSFGTGSRDTEFTAENLGFTEFAEAKLAARYGFTRRLTGEVLASYTRNDYQDQAGRSDDILSLQGGLSYLIRPWVTSSIRYTHKDTQSTSPGSGYTDDRITFGLSFVPTLPWVW